MRNVAFMSGTMMRQRNHNDIHSFIIGGKCYVRWESYVVDELRMVGAGAGGRGRSRRDVSPNTRQHRSRGRIILPQPPSTSSPL